MSLLARLETSLTAVGDQLFERLVGLGDAEYLWEPVGSMWTVRPVGDRWRADWADPDPEPAPVTTIAWRTWHISVDALDSYSLRAFGTSGTSLSGVEWVGTAVEAIDLTRVALDNFAAGLASLGDSGLSRQLGPDWGSYAEATHLDLYLHALREVTHHAAEIALLRDLYRSL